MTSETLTLAEAAAFLKLHPVTLRAKAARAHVAQLRTPPPIPPGEVRRKQ